MALAADPSRRHWPEAVGIAVKIDDGAERGYQPVIVEVLRRLGALPDGIPEALAKFAQVPVLITQRRQVGDVHAVFEWPA